MASKTVDCTDGVGLVGSRLGKTRQVTARMSSTASVIMYR